MASNKETNKKKNKLGAICVAAVAACSQFIQRNIAEFQRQERGNVG